MTKTLSTTCSQPKSDHYLEEGFTKKKAGPAHHLVPSRGTQSRGVARICERGFPARIAHAHNLRLRAGRMSRIRGQ